MFRAISKLGLRHGRSVKPIHQTLCVAIPDLFSQAGKILDQPLHFGVHPQHGDGTGSDDKDNGGNWFILTLDFSSSQYSTNRIGFKKVRAPTAVERSFASQRAETGSTEAPALSTS